MSHKTGRVFGFCLALVALPLVRAATTLAGEPPEPGTVITLADVEKVLGGKFKSRSPEPGALFYEEESGSREVHVYLWPADGKSVAEMKPQLVQQGEPVDDLAGIGDAAMYRPQGNEATVEKKVASGEVLWLNVSVHNVETADATKKLAVELAKRGAARL